MKLQKIYVGVVQKFKINSIYDCCNDNQLNLVQVSYDPDTNLFNVINPNGNSSGSNNFLLQEDSDPLLGEDDDNLLY